MMADHGGTGDPSVGGPVRHIPVLLGEVVDALAPEPGQVVLDGTFGAGGYSRAFLEAGAEVVAIDRDPDAIRGAAGLLAAWRERLHLVQGRFADLDEIARQAGFGPLDGVVLDIGVSSMQIDAAERGFSFQKDGPLDMRMSRAGPSAADAVNHLKPGDLARVLSFLGEERKAGPIARAIERRRAERPFERTLDLAEVVGRVVGRRPTDKIDPATRTFQALRAYVNDELGELARGLLAAERILKPGGRLLVVTFHSLEDRIVKRFLRSRSERTGGSRHRPEAEAERLTFAAERKPRLASEGEVAANPRSRSAKLRVATRLEGPPRDDTESFFDLPALADLPSSKD